MKNLTYRRHVIQRADGQFRYWDGEKYTWSPLIRDAQTYEGLQYLRNYYLYDGEEIVEYEVTARPTGRRTHELYPNGEAVND